MRKISNRPGAKMKKSCAIALALSFVAGPFVATFSVGAIVDIDRSFWEVPDASSENVPEYHDLYTIARASSPQEDRFIFDALERRDDLVITAALVNAWGGNLDAVLAHVMHVISPFAVGIEWTLRGEMLSDGRIIVHFTYAPDVADQLDAFNRELYDVLQFIPRDVSQEEQLKVINEIIVAICEYDGDHVEEGQGVYSALVTKQTVCAGMSKLFVVMALAVGIKAEVRTGTLTDGPRTGPHAVVCVTLPDGSTVYVDITANNGAKGVIVAGDAPAHLKEATKAKFIQDHKHDYFMQSTLPGFVAN